MSLIYNYSPGQLATIVFETLNDLGARADGYSIPVIERIIFPNLSLAVGYPQAMTRLDVGLFAFSFTLPTLATAVGSYIVDISYQDPSSGLTKSTLAQVVVNAQYGQYTASTF